MIPTIRTLTALLTLAVAATSVALADPATELRELDRLFKDGRISKSEYDRRWSEIVTEETNAPSVPRLNFKRPEPPRPPNEFSISGGGGVLEIGDTSETLYGASALLGRFLTPNLQLSVGVDYGRANDEDSSYNSLGGLGAIDFHFNPTAVFVPFVGVGASYTRVEIDEDSDYDWCVNAHVGVKQTIRKDTAIKYQITYFDHADLDIHGFGASLGVCLLF